MPLAGLPSLRAGRAADDEKPAVCEALENAGSRNPGGNIEERWVVADTRPPNMLRLEQCIVCGIDRVVLSRLLLTTRRHKSRESLAARWPRNPNPMLCAQSDEVDILR